MDLSGVWTGEAEELGSFQVKLPGTLDTNGVGKTDQENLTTRLTRLHTYEGTVHYSRVIRLPEIRMGRLFLKIERTRELTFEIDGRTQKPFEEGTLSTPWLFEVTEYAGKTVKLTFTVDNAYTRWPRESIIGASAATDETQTNWNGILGDFAVFEEKPVFFESTRIYPQRKTMEIRGNICGLNDCGERDNNLYIRLESKALAGGCVLLGPPEWKTDENGENLKISALPLASGCRWWDEEDGNLYTVNFRLQRGAEPDAPVLAETAVRVGFRTFFVDGGLRLVLNGRRFFLRGEANCCVFPEEGHPPMTEEAWRQVLETYAAYGVNCMRFHSWCPPEAAFAAADKMGMMMQPELSQWNFRDAFGTEAARTYYKKELFAVLKKLANHPSFVMLTLGNELQFTEEGKSFAKRLLDEARAYDHTRLYANSSNYHYGEEGADPASDFYTSMGFYKEMLRATSSPMIGHLNQDYPSACHNYEKTVKKVLAEGKPVYGFEVGQYEILPCFSEINDFHGVTRAVNLELIRENAERKGLLPQWEQYVEASGELAALCYREEVEAALRTEGMSGLILLGLQDFPGQGTALVGMLDSHLIPKPCAFAQSARFRAFFAPVVPLLYLKKYTWVGGEKLEARFCLANYGKSRIVCRAGWELREKGRILCSDKFEEKCLDAGGVRDVGQVSFSLPGGCTRRLDLLIHAGNYCNSYPIWVYKEGEVRYPENVRIAVRLTEELIRTVEKGETVFLEPDPTPENFPQSIAGQFSTDFWSVGTFPEQEGSMGLLIDAGHPALEKFPTEFFCNYQWWPMTKGRPMLLPDSVRPIVTVLDSCARLRHMGLLFEASLGKGRIMVSSMGLLEKRQYPECRGLLGSLLDYLGEEAACGKYHAGISEITGEALKQLVVCRPTM